MGSSAAGHRRSGKGARLQRGHLAGANDLPEDLALAAGLGKQRLYVSPSARLVVVRQGVPGTSRGFDDLTFLSLLFGRDAGLPPRGNDG